MAANIKIKKNKNKLLKIQKWKYFNGNGYLQGVRHAAPYGDHFGLLWWLSKYKNPPIWAKFGFQVDYDVANWYPLFGSHVMILQIISYLVFCCFSVSDPCGTLSNLTCSYACKLAGSTTSCYCKSGYELETDNKTCKGNLLTERIKGTNV
jgi:hypothetical protein